MSLQEKCTSLKQEKFIGQCVKVFQWVIQWAKSNHSASIFSQISIFSIEHVMTKTTKMEPPDMAIHPCSTDQPSGVTLHFVIRSYFEDFMPICAVTVKGC